MVIKQYDKPENDGEDPSKVKPDFLQMVTWCKKAWNELSMETLRNCGWKSELFPDLIPAPLHRKERASRKRVAPLCSRSSARDKKGVPLQPRWA
jgi:hypothetical protein